MDGALDPKRSWQFEWRLASQPGAPKEQGGLRRLHWWWRCYFGGGWILISPENFRHAWGTNDSVTLRAVLTKCFVARLVVGFVSGQSFLLGDTERPPAPADQVRGVARRSWRGLGKGLGAAFDHGCAEGRLLPLEVLLGSFDGFMQNCNGQIDSFRPDLLEFLQPQIPSWTRIGTIPTNRRQTGYYMPKSGL